MNCNKLVKLMDSTPCLVEFVDDYLGGDYKSLVEELNVWLSNDVKKDFLDDYKKNFE